MRIWLMILAGSNIGAGGGVIASGLTLGMYEYAMLGVVWVMVGCIWGKMAIDS